MKFIFSLRALLQVNPDVYTVWNWRREELILLTQQQPSEKIETLVVRELELSKAGIEKYVISTCELHLWHYHSDQINDEFT